MCAIILLQLTLFLFLVTIAVATLQEKYDSPGLRLLFYEWLGYEIIGLLGDCIACSKEIVPLAEQR